EYPLAPASWHRHAALFDEIRAPTRFAALAVANAIGQAVGLLPYPVALGGWLQREPIVRNFNAGEPLTLGFIGDAIAAFARKNAPG
ncbi:hypothetical protein, partial [Klebsiella pneumoniae]|uniref:hypothetical protein n=1 Tax=Klebsiella pneumoniae TaxID=573 RepID=UPI0019540D1F